MAVRCPDAAARAGTTPSLATVPTTVRRRHRRIPISGWKDSISPLRPPRLASPSKANIHPWKPSLPISLGHNKLADECLVYSDFHYSVFFFWQARSDQCLPLGSWVAYDADARWAHNAVHRRLGLGPANTSPGGSFLFISHEERARVCSRQDGEVAKTEMAKWPFLLNVLWWLRSKVVNRKGASPRGCSPLEFQYGVVFLFKTLCGSKVQGRRSKA